jgi:hypothetical protein
MPCSTAAKSYCVASWPSSPRGKVGRTGGDDAAIRTILASEYVSCETQLRRHYRQPRAPDGHCTAGNSEVGIQDGNSLSHLFWFIAEEDLGNNFVDVTMRDTLLHATALDVVRIITNGTYAILIEIK